MKIALVGGKVIDGNGGAPLSNGTVVIDGTKIVEVGQAREFGPDVLVLDVSGKTVMPGLIDCHMHFATWVTVLATQQMKPFMYHACQTVKALKMYLQAGCTTARDCGGLEVGWCDAQAEGLIEGPRLQTCVVQIQGYNGMMDWMAGIGGAITPQGIHVPVPGIPSMWANGVDEVRARVREVLRYGAHFVKAFNTAVPWVNPKLRPDRPIYTRPEIEALVDEAHRAGVPAEVHCLGEEATLDAVRAGADDIVHCYPMTEEIAEEMANRGTWWVPTATIINFHATLNPDPLAHSMAGKTWEEEAPRAFELAKSKGVRIAMGTDAGYGAEIVGKELDFMVGFGVDPMEAIKISTKNASELMRMDHLVGTLEAGKEADLLVVDGDPLEDMSVLTQVEKLSLVMQAGRACSGPMATQFPVEVPAYPFITV
jgi:imidazolonepropionase-like amidohydrolase